MENAETYIPKRPDPGRLGLPMRKGGAQREVDYAEWHRVHGQPLKRKYRRPK